MESLVAQVKSLASSADETGRRTLQTVLRDLAYSLEGYDDTVHRIGYYVRLPPEFSPSNLTSILFRASKSILTLYSTYRHQPFVLESTSGSLKCLVRVISRSGW